MSKESRLSPGELLRQLTLSAGRLATEGIASGAVRGATEELRAGLPELDGQFQDLLRDVLAILGRMAHEAAERPAWQPGARARVIAEEVVQGALGEFRRSTPGWTALSQELLDRVNQWLERSAEVAASRQLEIRRPGDRARMMATGAVEGALEQLHVCMPQLAPEVAGLASQVGRGFVEGVGSTMDEKTEVFSSFLERAGRSFVHALVEQLDTELKARRGAAEGAVRRATVEVTEQAAAACVRGASEELVRQVRALEASLAGESVLHRASREVSHGLLAPLAERLREPWVLAAGTGGVLLLGVFLARAR
ncbi:hypothetical protein D187_000216 [Cystobacter fuscus DSM 2262]|uniref:Uncharacterized protein n=1 Tax=Cystobacter fuscus (strain ATCC 25194 / DSM 2262 / NBRC 100088 / M29) TaxID=1242864 RepID=S9QTZ0_CYSF2|nr:hypothetical protein [Cystobacter fuscus]EPX64794.1 hypothetical protein D187_000216 [Cystobacter fuscus DSM 2262]